MYDPPCVPGIEALIRTSLPRTNKSVASLEALGLGVQQTYTSAPDAPPQFKQPMQKVTTTTSGAAGPPGANLVAQGGNQSVANGVTDGIPNPHAPAEGKGAATRIGEIDINAKELENQSQVSRGKKRPNELVPGRVEGPLAKVQKRAPEA